MKGIVSYELLVIFGFCIVLIGVFSISVIKSFTDTIVLFEARLAGDLAAIQGVGSTTCSFGAADKIYFDPEKKEINITYFTYSAPMPYGTCTIDKNVIKYILGNYTNQYKINY